METEKSGRGIKATGQWLEYKEPASHPTCVCQAVLPSPSTAGTWSTWQCQCGYLWQLSAPGVWSPAVLTAAP
jgi:hypothetical protein